MDVLEGILSFLLGIVIAVGIGIGFALRAIWILISYLGMCIIGLIFPRLREPLRLKWLLRDIKNGKKNCLHTGVFQKVELSGDETDGYFISVKNSMDTYQAQKKRRSALHEDVIPRDVFMQYDQRYLTLLRLFRLAVESINWEKVDIYTKQSHPAFKNLKTASATLTYLLSEQEKTLAHAEGNSQSTLNEDFAQTMEYLNQVNNEMQNNAKEFKQQTMK